MYFALALSQTTGPWQVLSRSMHQANIQLYFTFRLLHSNWIPIFISKLSLDLSWWGLGQGIITTGSGTGPCELCDTSSLQSEIVTFSWNWVRQFRITKFWNHRYGWLTNSYWGFRHAKPGTKGKTNWQKKPCRDRYQLCKLKSELCPGRVDLTWFDKTLSISAILLKLMRRWLAQLLNGSNFQN